MMPIALAWGPIDLLASLGTTLLHSVWQITLIALGFGIARTVVRRPATRHILGIVCLLAAATWPGITFLAQTKATTNHLIPQQNIVAPEAPDENTTPVQSNRGGPTEAMTSSSLWASPMLRPLRLSFALLWLLSTTGLLVRLVLGLGYLRSVKKRSSSDPQLAAATRTLEPVIRRLAQHVRLPDRLIRRIDLQVVHEQLGPCTFGLLRASVLIPMATVTGLPAPQLHAILLHELCHVRRHDAWFATLQAVLDCTLFFHPAARWMSQQVTFDREHACDELVLATSTETGSPDRTGYAQALLSLAKLRQRSPAVAAQGSNLQRRVRHILQLNNNALDNDALDNDARPRFRLDASSAASSAVLGLAVAASAAIFGLALAAPNQEDSPARPATEVVIRAQVARFDAGIANENLTWHRPHGDHHFEGAYLDTELETKTVGPHIIETLSAPTIVTHVGHQATAITSLGDADLPDQHTSESLAPSRHELELNIWPKVATNDLVLVDIALVQHPDAGPSDLANSADSDVPERPRIQLTNYVLQTNTPFLLLEATSSQEQEPQVGVILNVAPEHNGKPSLQLGVPELMTLSIHDADLLEVISSITRYAEDQLTFDPPAKHLLDATITLEAIAVPVAPLLELILDMACLQGSVQGSVLEVSARTDCQQEL